MCKFWFTFFSLVSVALAQTTGTATVVGTITDNTGAVVPGAAINIVNNETQFVYNGETNTEGGYYVPNLNPGTYRLTIQAQGFKRYVREGVILRTSEQPRIDVQLEVGSVTESINVAASAPLLETETTSTGQVLEGETIVKIPGTAEVRLSHSALSALHFEYQRATRGRAARTVARLHARRNRRQGARPFDDRLDEPGHFNDDRRAAGSEALHHRHARRVRPLRRRIAFDRVQERNEPVARFGGRSIHPEGADPPHLARAVAAQQSVHVPRAVGHDGRPCLHSEALQRQRQDVLVLRIPAPP